MLEKIEYKEINYEGALPLEAITEIKDLLTITKENSLLYICHPRHIFERIIEDDKTKIIIGVDWDSINTSLITKYDDYGRFSIVDEYFRSGKDQFTYVNKRFTNMLKKYSSKGNNDFTYPLAIIEEEKDRITNEKTYIPRGIICAKQGGVLLCNKMNSLEKTPQKVYKSKNYEQVII